MLCIPKLLSLSLLGSVALACWMRPYNPEGDWPGQPNADMGDVPNDPWAEAWYKRCLEYFSNDPCPACQCECDQCFISGGESALAQVSASGHFVVISFGLGWA